jgi:hypothetical protein
MKGFDMRFHSILIIMTGFFLSGIATADGLAIDAGKWEMTSTMTMTMMPTPQTNTVTECIKENELNPETINMGEENPCDISDVENDGNSISWSINCPTEGGMVMTGQWEMTSKGDSISGKGSMATEINGQTMGFDMTWDGKRIGSCD